MTKTLHSSPPLDGGGLEPPDRDQSCLPILRACLCNVQALLTPRVSRLPSVLVSGLGRGAKSVATTGVVLRNEGGGTREKERERKREGEREERGERRARAGLSNKE